jgi:homoserine O-acetyltransferase
MNAHRDLWWTSPTAELGKVVHLDLPEPFPTLYGGTLPAIQVSYEAWGELSAARDNAVLVIHPMTADCHVTGEYAGQPLGWWEPLIGPGRALDPEHFFVVCPNLLGGCYGTTGPRFPAPDGEPYLERFPLLAPRDMMRVQRRFLAALEIDRVALVIGPSMGGMIAWEWATEAPGAAARIAVVAAPLRTSPHQIGLNWLQRRGIELDITGNEVVATLGQMVARGVGMLSYRSPVGLEEKFGREWFKPPGSVLKERGMFNVESWLRHHGRRITQRFDPYTYLLFSRAMDLHDVSYGRGYLVSALSAVRDKVLVVGISSDNLYPPAEVKHGADLLDHLGADVRYQEIHSPNGHDAFLLDTDQLDEILRGFLTEQPVRTSQPRLREVRRIRAGVLGAGRVAASFIRLVADRQAHLVQQHGLLLEIGAVAEIDRAKQLDPVFAQVALTYEPDTLPDRQDLDVLVDLTRGLGSLPLVERTLRHRRPVVTPNKILVRAHGDALDRLAFEYGVRLAYHDSIAAGWPLILTLERSLSQARVVGLEAVLSSACNVILELLEEGVPLERAVAAAAARDLTEPDPELDTSGWDSAQKLMLLLSRATGHRYLGHEVELHGLDTVDPVLVQHAPQRDLRIKLVAMAAEQRGQLAATVRPMAVRRESHLGLVRGPNNVVVTYAPDGTEMVYSGTGAGALPVATAVLNDLIGLFDPQHSWTGRFPAVSVRLPALQFSTWVYLEDAELRTGTTERPGAVPLVPTVRRDGALTGNTPSRA